MATLDEYKAYSPTWPGIGSQIAVSASISLACLGVHELFRKRSDFRHLFSARCYLPKNPSPPPSKQFLGWARTIWRIEETFILHNVGLDAVLYLRALKLIFQVMIFLTVIVMPILLPVNYFNDGVPEGVKGTVQEFSITGVGKGSNKFWVHTLLSSVISLVVLYLIYKNTVDFVQLRRIHFLKEANDGNPRCRTVMVTNIPEVLCDEVRLRDHFESLGLGQVHCVQLLKYPHKLIDYMGRRKKALIGLETAHTELARNLLLAVKEGHLLEEAFLKYDNGWEYQQINQYLRDPQRFSNAICSEETKLKLMLQTSIESETISIWDIILRLNYQILAPFHPYHRTGYKTGKRCQSISYFYNKIIILDRRINKLRNENENDKDSSQHLYSDVTSTGFVTFANPASAQLCAQSIIHPSINKCQTYLAPEPKDILWKNHTMSKSSKLIRKVLVNVITWILIIAWLIPVIPLLSLVSFDSLSLTYPELAKFGRNYPLAQSLLQTLVPATLLAIFMSILPHILYIISSIESWKTFSGFERAVAIRYHYFCIFNVVFLFLLGPAFIDLFLKTLESKYNFVEEFATKIAGGAAFFINYVIFNICYQFMELLILASPFILSFMSWVFPKSPRERKVLEHSWPFPFFYHIPNHLLIFVIVATYSTVNPFIIPFGLIYFFTSYFIFKHNFIYCYIKRYESNGKIWNLFVRFLTDGLIISQLTNACILITNAVYYALIPTSFTLMTIFYFKYYYRKTFRQRLMYIPLDSLKEAEPSPRSSIHRRSSPSSPRASLEVPSGLRMPHFKKDLMFNSPSPLVSPATLPASRNTKLTERPALPESFLFTVSDPSGKKTNILEPSNSDAFDRSLSAISEANGEDDIEEQPNWIYYAQAFTHPALTKPIPKELCVSKYPHNIHYDLYKDVLKLDLIASTSESHPPRNLIVPDESSPESGVQIGISEYCLGLENGALDSQISLSTSQHVLTRSQEDPIIVDRKVVGEIIALGKGVTNFKLGDRVGVGAQCAACLLPDCKPCSVKQDAQCPKMTWTYNDKRFSDGAKTYGGYADKVRVQGDYAFHIPESIPSDYAAPLLCAGAT
ncbi:DUF221-domain-containing protein, partial [Neoconidiobolus thromboides FSU 785]